MNEIPVEGKRLPVAVGFSSEPAKWLAAITESSEAGVMAESLDGRITAWSRGATQMFGYTAEEAIGKAVMDLVWPGEEPTMREMFAKAKSGERVDHIETSRRHRDGHRVFVSLSLFPIRTDSGDIIGIAKIARDLTDRKRMEEQQAQVLAHRRFQEMMENAPDGILEVDADGTIIIANKTAGRMFGYSDDELVGSSIDKLVPAAHRLSHPARRAQFIDAGRTRPMGHGADLKALRKDGSEFPAEISLSPVRSSSGTFVVAVIRDVTDRRRYEEQVRALQEAYMAEVSARHDEAERLNQLKSEFMASVSHELRTPLHTIIGFADLLKEETAEKLNDKEAKFLTHILRDAEHLLVLINDVLDISRAQAGGLILHAEVVSVRTAVDEVTSSFARQARDKGVHIDVKIKEDLYVAADFTRLRQILSNLVSNGIKFTPTGGNITVSARKSKSDVEIRVTDTGIGIPEQEQKRIFEKFYQVGTTTGGVREGTGLGLAICKELIDLHGGTLYVESAPGKGSSFYFCLPCG